MLKSKHLSNCQTRKKACSLSNDKTQLVSIPPMVTSGERVTVTSIAFVEHSLKKTYVFYLTASNMLDDSSNTAGGTQAMRRLLRKRKAFSKRLNCLTPGYYNSGVGHKAVLFAT